VKVLKGMNMTEKFYNTRGIVCGRCKNMVTSCPLLRVVLGLRLEGLFLMARVKLYGVDLMGMMRFV
jgi:hypothetical protein